MRFSEFDLTLHNQLAAQYREEGMAVVRCVELPDVFQPQVTDFVFLDVNGTCEVYMGSNVAYTGRGRIWRQIVRQEPGPGGTRLALSTRGDFLTGLNKTKALLEEAGGNYSATRRNPVPAEHDPVEPARSEPAVGPSPVVQEVDTPLPDNTPRGSNRGFTARLRQGPGRVLRDLVEEWRRNPRELTGRADVLHVLKTNMIRESKPGVVMVGKPGVGKSCIVELLARDIATNHELPPALENTPIYDLPLGSFVENARYIGDIERQVRQVLDFSGNPIFFADEFHQLARPELNALCDLLKPGLAAGQIRLIGATTPMEWRRIEDKAFKRRFLEMTNEEPEPAEAFIMAKERVKALMQHHQLGICDELVREAVMLSARYLPMQQFPDKAIDVLDLAAAIQIASQTCSQVPVETPADSGTHTEHGCLMPSGTLNATGQCATTAALGSESR